MSVIIRSCHFTITSKISSRSKRFLYEHYIASTKKGLIYTVTGEFVVLTFIGLMIRLYGDDVGSIKEKTTSRA